MEPYQKHTQVFKALGDPKRAMIVDMLSCGELCACNILEKFDMSQSTLSHHMKLLCACGLVKARNVGKWTHYSLSETVIGETKQFFCRITTERDDCICKETAGCCSELEAAAGCCRDCRHRDAS